MKINLLRYMSARLQEECGEKKEPGPVITISRLYGCPANKVARQLTQVLTEKMIARGYKTLQWKFVSKEIMSESARALEVDPAKIKYVFDYEQKGLIDEIFSAHSDKYYKSDRKIRNTIAEVVRNIACEGHVVIVGRGGVAITHDIKNSLHINLEAPLQWRVLRIGEKFNLSFEDAEKLIVDVDRKRQQFRESFQGGKNDYTRFDITFNCMTLSIDEIVSVIVRAAETRKFI